MAAAGTQFAQRLGMRSVCGAIFLGFAVIGFAGVFNAHNPARPTTRNATIPDDGGTVQPATNPSSITVRTVLVRAHLVQTHAPEPTVRPIRAAAHYTRTPPPRSRLARVLFGDGQFRPRPFPTPAKN